MLPWRPHLCHVLPVSWLRPHPLCRLPRRDLADHLRLYVNMFRSGWLITTDIIKQVISAMIRCGWEDAGANGQQDPSEVYTFIANQLHVPLITLMRETFHNGQEDMLADHKIELERTIELGIPEPEEGDGGEMALIDLLCNFFSAKVEVGRVLPKKLADLDSQPSTPRAGDSPRAKAPHTVTSETAAPREEIIPAWQMSKFLPFFTYHEESLDPELARHFADRRPVLAICLKRYSASASGTTRRNDFVQIPLEMHPSDLVGGDDLGLEPSASKDFRLVLQSAICHRGKSTDYGHYITLFREHPAQWPGTEAGIPEEKPWKRFDDLNIQERIKSVDIHQALRQETPYLLFYQVQSTNAETALVSEKPGQEIPSTSAEKREIVEGTMPVEVDHEVIWTQTRRGIAGIFFGGYKSEAEGGKPSRLSWLRFKRRTESGATVAVGEDPEPAHVSSRPSQQTEGTNRCSIASEDTLKSQENADSNGQPRRKRVGRRWLRLLPHNSHFRMFSSV
ncbi:cysteine proteinase [Piedraia hortae CBS 480.64]|uniref:Cysteine proteinase n=1 Tax=Piedraia hortae CBS 480.64 TaxID=1314780 RepID=A0A6A7BW74_9PEZI|nr:cysteine proteinase [Piedraia hortae CBS 480.64]